jgi:hypothetical protein
MEFWKRKMTTRKQLEETLAAQRARRSRILPPIRPLRKNGGGLAGARMMLVIVAASGAAMFFALGITTPEAGTAITASPSASSLLTPTTVPATPVTKQVCTHIPNGRLHVRFAAGEGSEVRGYLAEGETIQLAPATDGRTLQGELWLPISYPIAGWVNARFVCTQEK